VEKKMTMKSRLQQFRDFLLRGLWELDPLELRAWKRLFLKSLQFVTAVVREFFADNCLLHASALAFTTILSFVPLLAVMFALLKGFGAEIELEILILNHLALGSEEAVDAIFTYISNTNMAKLGTFGVIFLLITVLTLLNSIEKSFEAGIPLFQSSHAIADGRNPEPPRPHGLLCKFQSSPAIADGRNPVFHIP